MKLKILLLFFFLLFISHVTAFRNPSADLFAGEEGYFANLNSTYIIDYNFVDQRVGKNSLSGSDVKIELGYYYVLSQKNKFVSENFLNLILCPSTIPGMLALYMIVGISLTLIMVGSRAKIGVIGSFGCIGLMVGSWYISPCISLFSYVLGLLSLILLIWFVIKGVGFRNLTFK